MTYYRRKLTMYILLLALIALAACAPNVNPDYDTLENPFGMTTREYMRTEANRYAAEMDYKARSEEAFYEYKGTAAIAAAQQTTARMETARAALWAGVTPLVVLMFVVGIVLAVALVQLARVITGSQFVPPLKDEYWQGTLSKHQSTINGGTE